MEPEFWHARWQQNQIGFHQAQVTPLLARHHQALGPASGSRVLVPLCGKTLDMTWLAAQGRSVVGVELSPLAVAAFFSEQGVSPSVESLGALTRQRAGAIEILCGDLFAVTPEHVGPVNTLFDRAALVALPEPMRARYVAKLAELLPAAARGLLVTFEYEPTSVSGPPFSIDGSTVHALYDAKFAVAELERTNTLAAEPRFRERGATSLHECAYQLTRR